MSLHWQLLNSFFKIGLFTFGGGYAMLPLLKAEVVEHRKWLTEDELLDYFSIGQCTPGIIAVNVATFCGYRVKGILGAMTATFAIVLPSLIIITLIASVLRHFTEYSIVSGAFAGIRIGVTALLFNLVADMGKKVYKNSKNKPLHIGIFLGAFILLMCLKASAVSVVIAAVVAGLIPYFYVRRKQ